tara:strand:- start:944 stop:1219 length:276 start_codon:yes stop_codon:yes gene_type:complete
VAIRLILLVQKRTNPVVEAIMKIALVVTVSVVQDVNREISIPIAGARVRIVQAVMIVVAVTVDQGAKLVDMMEVVDVRVRPVVANQAVIEH